MPTRRHATRPRCRTGPRTATGFTLVELLIVVVILAILAAIVLPQFTGAAEQTRKNTLATNLYRIRQQIVLYRHHHNGAYPHLADFVDQMTGATNRAGEPGAPDAGGYPFGPYLNRIPRNPYTNGNTVGGGDIGDSDWYYDQATGAFHANHTEAARDL